MKFLTKIWIVLLVSVCVNCSSNNTTTNPFTKQVEVFGIHIYATSTTGDDKILHAANVMAQYLDNDEDGIPDNQKIVDAMVSKNAAITMGRTSQDLSSADKDALPPGPKQDLWDTETFPNGSTRGKYDASLEEVLHLITNYGWEGAYPSAFGRKRGTDAAKSSELARGGYFEDVPEKYPDEAWHTYYDETCHYRCQIGEYLHWAFTSILGGQDYPGTFERGKDQWDLRTNEQVRLGDPAVYALLTNPKYKLPTVLPDKYYKGQTFMIQEYP
jgi:hypothetical protein